MLPQMIPREIRDWEVTVPGRDGGREKQFTVTTKFAAMVNLTSLQDFIARRGQMAPRDAMQVSGGARYAAILAWSLCNL